eukprot:Phypoly_transcript_14838.p1 GENE.Phypoly_transcript_14838~~Phypoly_transcript_14838.p1  ORF type:complete len:243 (+),score=17.46 Phypoly_transcript_14838:53-781(+)
MVCKKKKQKKVINFLQLSFLSFLFSFFYSFIYFFLLFISLFISFISFFYFFFFLFLLFSLFFLFLSFFSFFSFIFFLFHLFFSFFLLHCSARFSVHSTENFFLLNSLSTGSLSHSFFALFLPHPYLLASELVVLWVLFKAHFISMPICPKWLAGAHCQASSSEGGKSKEKKLYHCWSHLTHFPVPTLITSLPSSPSLLPTTYPPNLLPIHFISLFVFPTHLLYGQSLKISNISLWKTMGSCN